jgi:hypothetical protein
MKTFPKIARGVAGLAILTFAVSTVQAQLIDVNFVGNAVGTAYGGGGPPSPGPSMTGGAVLGGAGDQWNNIGDSAYNIASYPNGISGGPIALINANGSASGVSMSLTASSSYNANEPNWGNHSPFTTAASPYSNLMQDMVYANTPQSITLSGLANSAYNLVLYNAGDQNVGTGRLNTFSVNGVTQTSMWDGVTSTLVAGVDYVQYSAAITTGGTLVINFGAASGETDLDGFQLSVVPEPATLALAGLGIAALSIFRRRI